MLHFEKSQPAPECLEKEKTKANGNYRCGTVIERLKTDFKNKCYICENSQPHSVNVEHFRPHRGDQDLKFSWDNLFWSCAHCNNIKLDKFENILNCTSPTDQVEEKLKYKFKPFPHEHVEIEALESDASTLSTKALIEAVFNGTTQLKIIESSNIRNHLLEEIREFQTLLCEYYKETCDIDDKKFYLRKIKGHLHPASNFTSFKRWIIRENSRLMKDFGKYII